MYRSDKEWTPADGIGELWSAIKVVDEKLVRSVGERLSTSGYTFEQAQQWLSLYVRNPRLQHEVSSCWDGISFACGAVWLH